MSKRAHQASDESSQPDSKRSRAAVAEASGLDVDTLHEFVSNAWDTDVIPKLHEYIKIPNQSPEFDPDWESNGLMAQAMDLLEAWVKQQSLAGTTIQRLQEPGRTPVLFVDVAASDASSPASPVLLYGHMDKQPPLDRKDWGEHGPYEPVVRDGRLYGRGGADDGYSTFAAVVSVLALQKQGVPHARCCILIEASEESGSLDLPYYVEQLGDKLGSPSLIVCLDSGAMSYDTMWATTSLRGAVSGQLRVDVVTEGVHSGDASGVVPSSFRILRSLISRLEDAETGLVVDDLQVEIPPARIAETQTSVDQVGAAGVYGHFPLLPGMSPVTTDLLQVQLNRTWRAQLSTIGMGGLPTLEAAGNVLRTHTIAKLSMRIAPTADHHAAAQTMKRILEADPPYGARVAFHVEDVDSGWNAPAFQPWLVASMDAASRAVFGKPVGYLGEGGSIPFMGMLGEKFPQAQFVITGVLGPNSNAHGPREFLDIQTGKRITSCVAIILADHHRAATA